MFRARLATTALAVLSSSLASAQVNLVANGGFESPSITPGTYDVFMSIPGWTPLSPSARFELWNNLFGWPSPEGQQHLECDDTRGEQFLATVPGCTYDVSLMWSPRPGVPSNRVAVEWDGQRVIDVTGNGSTLGAPVWSSVTTRVQATSASTRLVLLGLGTDSAVGMLVDDLRVVRAEVGTVYCSPSVANSTGAGATIQATGSTAVADDALSLVAEELPPNSFGFFLVSTTQGFAANPGGSQGNLCLGGQIGRYVGPGQIQNSGAIGTFCMGVGLGQIPTPTGFTSVQPGETWHFQAWYRDANPAVTSNFTDGVSVAFV